MLEDRIRERALFYRRMVEQPKRKGGLPMAIDAAIATALAEVATAMKAEREAATRAKSVENDEKAENANEINKG